MLYKLTSFTKKVFKLPSAFNLANNKLLDEIKKSRRIILAALLFLAAFVITKLLSTSACKRKLEVYISHRTHKQLSIGSMDVSLFPTGISCREIAIKSPEYVLHAEGFSVSLAILPTIFTGRIIADSITLIKPILDIYQRNKPKRSHKRKYKKTISKRHSPSKPVKHKEFTFSLFKNLVIEDGKIRIHRIGEVLELPFFSLSAKAVSKTKLSLNISSRDKVLLNGVVFTGSQSSLYKTTMSQLHYRGKIELPTFNIAVVKNHLSNSVCLNEGYCNFSGDIEGVGKYFKLLGDFSVYNPILSIKNTDTMRKDKIIKLSMVSSKVKALKNKSGLQVILPNLIISKEDVRITCRGGYKLSRKNKPYLFLEGESKKLPASFIQNFITRCSVRDKDTIQCEKLNISGTIENMSFVIEGNPLKMSTKKLFSVKSWLNAKMEFDNCKLVFTHYKGLPSLSIKSGIFFKDGCIFVNNMSITSGKILLNNMQGILSPRREGGFYHINGNGVFPVSDTLNFAYSFGKKKHPKKLVGSGTANVSFGISHGMRSGIKMSLLANLDDSYLAYDYFEKKRGVPAQLNTNMEFPPEGGMFFYSGNIELGTSNINFIGQRLLRAFYFVESKEIHLKDVAYVFPKINRKMLKGEGSIKGFINIGTRPDKRLAMDGTFKVDGVSYKGKLYEIEDLSADITAKDNDTFNIRLSAESFKNKNMSFKELLLKAKLKNIISKYAPRLHVNMSNAQGIASLQAKDGMFKKYGLLGKIFAFLHPIELFKKSLSDWQSDSFMWKNMSGDFDIKNGILKTKNLFLGSSFLDFTAIGNLDLSTHVINSSIYAKPFSPVENTLKNILALSKLTKTEQVQILSLGFEIHGDINKPKIKPLPSTFYKIKKGVKKVGKQLEKTGKKLLKGIADIILGQ